MLIQIHMLQNYAPSNLNRDDSGSPKSTIFGNVRRGRISSQSIKRSIRQSDTFEAEFASSNLLAKRTLLLPDEVRQRLINEGATEPEAKLVAGRLQEIGQKEGKSSKDEKEAEDTRQKTKMLIFLAGHEIDVVTKILWQLYQDLGEKKFKALKVKDLEKSLKHATPRSVDVAMFGRMTTSVAFEDMHAAVQVAHAFSTHAVEEEFDYFTAVDDLTHTTGAGMIGDMEFNSSTYYKYFNIQWEKLLENLGGDVEIAKQAVAALIEAASTAHPSGKQNSTAALNLPDFVLVDVKARNLPVSLANAFQKPLRANYEGSLMDNSVKALSDYNTKLKNTFNLGGQQAYISTIDPAVASATDAGSLGDLKQWVLAQITEVANG